MTTAVVTGAAGAIGAQICRRLAERGYQILAVDIDSAGLVDLQESLPANVSAHRCDLTDPVGIASIADAVERCDLLVHTAGIVVTTPFERTTSAEINREIGLNLVAPMQLTRALFPALQASSGHVISVVSLASLLPMAEGPGYTASKFGLRGFLLALSAQTPETGVRISIVNPGAVDTPMLRHEAANGGSVLQFLSTPLGAGHVADRVVALLDRPRLETNLPAYDGWLIKVGMLLPSVTLRVLPSIARLAESNLTQYRNRYGIQGANR